jgi:hypothetical protein
MPRSEHHLVFQVLKHPKASSRDKSMFGAVGYRSSSKNTSTEHAITAC